MGKRINMKKKIVAIFLMFTVVLSSSCNVTHELKKSFGKTVNIQDVFEETCAYGNTELIDELLDTGEITQETLNNGLGRATGNMCDIYLTMTHLIQKGADANTGELLWQAAYNDLIFQLAALLTDKKLDINKKSMGKYSALYMAMENHRGGMDYTAYNNSKMLLDKGAEIYPEMFQNEGDSKEPQYSYNQLSSSVSSARLLVTEYLKKKDDIDIPEALKYALCGESAKCIQSIREGKEEITESDQTIIQEYVCCYGTPEEYEELYKKYGEKYKISYPRIAECGNTEMLRYLFKKNEVKIDYKKVGQLDLSLDKYEECLDYAALWGHYDTCKFLCESGMRSAKAIGCGYSALSYAISSGNVKLIKYLYNYIKSYEGKITEEYLGDTIELCEKKWGSYMPLDDKRKEIYDFLFSKGHNFSDFQMIYSDEATNEYLIEHGMKVSDENINYMASHNQKKALEAAFKKGYHPVDETLRNAVVHGSSDTVKLILDNGAEIPDDILNSAVLASKATVKVLIDAGANKDLKLKSITLITGDTELGDYDLKDCYKMNAREDLLELLD